MKILYLVLSAYIFFLRVQPVNAQQRMDFIDYVSRIIYEGCQAQQADLELRNKMMPDFSTNVGQGKINFVEYNESWLKYPNYSLDLIKNIVTLLNSITFKSLMYVGDEKIFSDISTLGFGTSTDGKLVMTNEGNDLLRCGKNALDISGNTFYWNRKKIELPAKIEVSNIALNNSGNLVQGFSLKDTRQSLDNGTDDEGLLKKIFIGVSAPLIVAVVFALWKRFKRKFKK